MRGLVKSFGNYYLIILQASNRETTKLITGVSVNLPGIVGQAQNEGIQCRGLSRTPPDTEGINDVE